MMTPADSRTALILGGKFHALGAARSLGQHGIRVYITEVRPRVAQFSRYVRKAFRVPATTQDETFCASLRDLAVQAGLHGAVLFPSDDEAVRRIAQHHQELSQYYVLTTPEWDVIRSIYDKRLSYPMAASLGVPVPETHYPTSRDELLALPIEYPVVLKPAISTHLMAAAGRKAYKVDDRAGLLVSYDAMAAAVDPREIMVQEYIPGRAANLYSCFGYFRSGEPVAAYCARRSRQHPMEFGRATTFAETVDMPDMVQQATRLLKALDYTGLAEVEFMYDPKHARYEFLEINARIWGWHTLSIRAGVDLPYLAYQEAVGGVAEVGTYRPGVKWVRTITDVPTVLSELWHRRMSLRQYMKSLRGDVQEAVFSWRDPLPFLAELVLIAFDAGRGGV